MEIILLLSLIFFSIIALIKPNLATLFIIGLLPSYLIRFEILSIPMTFLEAIILITFAFWFIKTTNLKVKSWFKNRVNRIPYPFATEIIAILLISFISVIVAKLSLSAMGAWKAYFFEPILLFILILNTLPKRDGRKKIIIALSISALLTSLLAIFQKITGLFIFNEFWQSEPTRRIVSWFGYPNAVGLYLAPIVFISLGLLVDNFKTKKEDIIKRIFIAITIILSILAIYFARSEGALIAILASSLLFLFFSSKKGKIVSLTIIILSSLIIGIHTPTRFYVLNKVKLQDLSGEIRKQQWRETMQSLQGPNFFIGHGLSNYPRAVSPYHQEGIFFNKDRMDNFHSILYGNAELRKKYWQPVEIYLYPHNIFLNFWTELGLMGLLAFTWLIGKFLYKSFNIFRKENNFLSLGLFCSMLTIVIHGLVDVPYFKNDLSALFFIILALLSSIIAENKYKNKKQYKV